MTDSGQGRRWLLLAFPVVSAVALVAANWIVSVEDRPPGGPEFAPSPALFAWSLLPVLVLVGLVVALLLHPRRESTVVVAVACVVFTALTAAAVADALLNTSPLRALVFVVLPLPQLLVLAVAAAVAVLLRLRRPLPPPEVREAHPPSVFSSR